jgi:hypothetical protein
LPYRFVWSAAAPAELATAFAHVHLSVSLPDLTPGLPDVFGVPVHPLNLDPPGVSFVVEVADWLDETLEETVLCVLLDAAPSLALWPCPLSFP